MDELIVCQYDELWQRKDTSDRDSLKGFWDDNNSPRCVQ